MQAIILVDIQKDFLPGGALAVPEGDRVIAVANELLAHCDLVVATQDWHPDDHGSFAKNHPGKRPGDRVQLAGCDQILWPTHCVQHTDGAKLAANLNVDRITRVFPKGTQPEVDSYSGFFDNGRLRATGLGDFLYEQHVTEVYLAGLATDYCVKATALDACQLGFRTYVIKDACRGVNLQPGDDERALEEVRAAGGQVLTRETLPMTLRRSGNG